VSGLTSNDESAVTALSARSNGLDDIDGGPERGDIAGKVERGKGD
jgi:hypothetical protein